MTSAKTNVVCRGGVIQIHSIYIYSRSIQIYSFGIFLLNKNAEHFHERLGGKQCLSLMNRVQYKTRNMKKVDFDFKVRKYSVSTTPL